MKQILYNNRLAKQWIDWVEKDNPKGTREKEIYPFIKDWIKELKPKIVADIGCGQGSCSTLFNNSINYIGIDSSATLIKRARELFPNKKFVKGNAYFIPLKNESVDAVVSIWVWSHLEKLKLASEEMSRILKTNGNFLIITANPETYKERKTFYKQYKIKNKLLTGDFDLGRGKVLSNTTLYLHAKKDILSSIEKTGLIVDATKRMGKTELNNKGLYLVIKGRKK